MTKGCLFLVVGPSGAGKDTLLDAARDHFEHTPWAVHFPKRYITRDHEAGGEDHLAVNPDRFELLRLKGQLAFWWEAHNLKYGIPEEINHFLDQGTHIVVNVSRSILEEARLRYDNLRIISITVKPPELEKRLRARGRESEDDIQKRLERAQAFRVIGPDVLHLDNSADLETAIHTFIKMIDVKMAKKQTA